MPGPITTPTSLNKYLAYQFSGKLAQNTINAVLDQYTLSDSMLLYWHDLSIDNADTPELEAIGYLVGLPWPMYDPGIWSTNSFQYTNLANQGTSDLTGYNAGGYISNSGTVNDRIPIGIYRMALKAFARLKWNGLSMSGIDQAAFVFGNDYLLINGDYHFFEYTNLANPGTSSTTGYSAGRYSGSTATYPKSDIYVSYNTDIGQGNVQVLQGIFDMICTAPQVFVSIGV